jgi:metal-responsive CopG/Arc/MetJ family transcriptional regulator
MIPPDNRMPPKLASSVRKVNLITPAEWLERVDNWRRHQPDLPNRSEAIRKLVEMGLDTTERKPKAKPKG